ncbi:hypothetical protein niasHT_032318 [Heterodera trifolii]|uniref:Uncharacterized protein n=1 Tax=Heterodera trifolii TaxID=157864 RepID=A0ABD2HVS0_9BILA
MDLTQLAGITLSQVLKRSEKITKKSEQLEKTKNPEKSKGRSFKDQGLKQLEKSFREFIKFTNSINESDAKFEKGNNSKAKNAVALYDDEKELIKITKALANQNWKLGRSRSTSIIGRFATGNSNEKPEAIKTHKNGANAQIRKSKSLRDFLNEGSP